MTDDPDFYAWLDGELPEPQASVMAARVAADPGLAALAEQHRTLAGRLCDAFAPILSAPLPERLLTAAEPWTAEIIPLAQVRARRRQWSVVGLAAAASLAFGLVIGVAMRGGEGSYRSDRGQLAAAGPLDRALDRQFAAAGEQLGIRMGLSFRDRDGRYCRSFTAEGQSGLACRGGEDWIIEGLVRRSGQEQGNYRMAGGQDPALTAIIDSRMGEPLDAQTEAQAIERQWQQ
ncbi:anti-sigma factor family protein [Sphingomonas sp. GCM10030256]|uniref:anti-sigma factor family protein n=1 Tax=Sphingomonas sp. GCM10030256 TaxID=3273427 RepID=UPI00361B4C39